MRKTGVLSAFVFVLCLGWTAQSALAQKVEITPYGGIYFPNHWRDNFQLKRSGIYGVEGGGFIGDRWEIAGNFGYINHFVFSDFTSPKSRAFVYEVGPTINLYHNLFQHVFPYVSARAGALTGWVGDVNIGGTNPETANLGPVSLSRGDTFFQFSYGGGLKAWNLWGPVGLRVDARGRTMPNFFGNSTTWLETTGGVTFTWGER